MSATYQYDFALFVAAGRKIRQVQGLEKSTPAGRAIVFSILAARVLYLPTRKTLQSTSKRQTLHSHGATQKFAHLDLWSNQHTLFASFKAQPILCCFSYKTILHDASTLKNIPDASALESCNHFKAVMLLSSTFSSQTLQRLPSCCRVTAMSLVSFGRSPRHCWSCAGSSKGLRRSALCRFFSQSADHAL